MATTALSWPLFTGRCSLPIFDSHSSVIRNRYPPVHKYGWNPLVKPCNAKGFLAVKLSLQQIPDPEHLNELVDGAAQGFVDRTERLLYSLADAAAQKQDGDWLAGLTNTLETILKVLKDALSTMHVPYAYGFAIILLTVLVKAATFPLTKKQVESTMSMQSLQPKIKAIQQQYAGDQERIQLETARLYKQAGVNPLAGCLPTLATIPVWIGLYRALSNVANEGLLTEGFFWIPSLAGPTTIAARQNGSGISWLFPFVDGHPPLGWSDTLAYLVLPVLLIVSQYISMQIMQPPQVNDPSQKNTQAILKFLPLMIGYFALSVPSGLSLYWLTNNILSTTQQVWLRKLGGAKPVVEKGSDRITNAEEEKRPPSQLVVDSKEIRRGERFKQLKAEEAKRRKEREEAARRAAEEASKAVAKVSEQEQLHSTQSAEETQSIDSSAESDRHDGDEEGHNEQASNSSMGKYVQSAEETVSTDSSATSDGYNGDEEGHNEQASNSSVAKESLEEVYANNGSGATSDSLEPKRSEQSKQRGAA